MSRTSAVLLRSQSDERLVALARSGQERAFETIVRRYRRPLLSACRRMVDDGRAEDVLQQSLMAAWGALQRGDEVRDLRPWLFRIVRNAAVSHRRRAGHPAAELLETLGVADGPQEEAERREVIRDALETIAGLPPRQRDALLSIAVQGRSQDEVAAELGVSRIAVRQLVHRARTSLRTAATALAPLPLMSWAAGTTASEPLSLRIASLITGAGGMGAAATFAKAGAVAGVAASAVAGPSLVERRPAAPVAADVVAAPPQRTPRATRPTPAAPVPDLVAARVGNGEAKPPAATPAPRRVSAAAPVRKSTRRSRPAAADDKQTGRAGDRQEGNDDDVPTPRPAEKDSGERDAGEVSRDDGEAKPPTETARSRRETAASGGGENDGAAEPESDSHESHTPALAVAEPDQGSGDENDSGAEQPGND